MIVRILIALFVGALYAAFLTFRDEWKDKRERKRKRLNECDDDWENSEEHF